MGITKKKKERLKHVKPMKGGVSFFNQNRDSIRDKFMTQLGEAKKNRNQHCKPELTNGEQFRWP
jgi:hypothetical protein